MLIALGLLALIGFWWLGRRNGRLPFGLTPRLLAGYALLAAAFVLSLRGSFLLALLLGAGGVWLSEGEAGVIRRVRAWRGYREPRQVRTAALEFDLGTDGEPMDGTVLVGPLRRPPPLGGAVGGAHRAGRPAERQRSRGRPRARGVSRPPAARLACRR
ncbi:protein of unknown function [Methylorubrum extorquens]|uniref:Uncharacterized protein n=1 Tax=Methylorubrum extorquens TaxID=408 RepID=A0A2N9AI19_METEX|nr:protein of unknown function [Methylorubrum extorquens]